MNSIIRGGSNDYLVLSAALSGIRADSAVPRADAKGHPLTESGLLTYGYLRRIREARADSADLIQPSILGARIDYRADSTTFFADALVAKDATVTFTPQRENALVASIPVDRVPAAAESWTARYAQMEGVAKPFQRGSTDAYIITGSAREEIRPMMMLRVDTVEHYGDAERASFAGGDVAITQADEAREAIQAHLRAHNQALLSGIAGFGGYHLGNLPGALRKTSTAVFGTLGSGVVDAALAEFRAVIQAIPEESNGTMPAPDTMLITRRGLNRLGSYIAFEAGGSGYSQRLVSDFLSAEGITQIALCDELRNFGGALVDGMTLFNRANPGSLRQKLGLAPAPVKSFDADLGRRTAYLSSLGGLYAKLGGSVLVYGMKVTA
jgi:hypothetical protein